MRLNSSQHSNKCGNTNFFIKSYILRQLSNRQQVLSFASAKKAYKIFEMSQFWKFKQKYNEKEMKKLALSLLILSLMSFGASIALSQGLANLQSDSGKYLSRCNGCGPGVYPNSATVHGTDTTAAWAQWTIEFVGDKVSLKSDSGQYLAVCTNCWNSGADPDSAFIYVDDPSANEKALWTPVAISEGKWAFQASSGKFLARCNGCVPGGAAADTAFVHVESPEQAPWAQWTVSYVEFPLGNVNLLSDNGKYLARCENCGPGADPDSAAIYEEDGTQPKATWTAELFGDKIALKSDSGKYLARCNGCWGSGATFGDSAFVHVTEPEDKPWALWTPVDLKNGKWAFQSDSGRFLARCEGCVTGGAYSDFALVHVETPEEAAYAQFIVGNL